MASPAVNVFTRLHKWAWRQDENFLTESLAVVLENLLILAPPVGTRLVSRLTGGFIDLPPEDAGAIAIDAQVEAGRARPDLEIGTPDRLVWVEVKVESGLRTGQLEGYRVLLGERRTGQTRLVLLTHHPETFGPGAARPDLEVRWFELADWLADELPAAEGADPIAGFLTGQFLSFLGDRGMTLAQVGKYMPEGLRALSNLMNMLVRAAEACQVSVKNDAKWNEYIGLQLDQQKYWVGVYYAEPERLWFSTQDGCRVDPGRVAKLGAGELTTADPATGQYRWSRGEELESEQVHFFARSKLSQMQWLEGFLRECLDQARSIEASGQPPVPEQPGS